MWPTPLTCRRRTSCGWSSRSRRLARPWRVVLRQLRLLPQRRLPLWLIPVSVLLRPQRSQTSRWWTCRWRSCQRSQRTLSRKMLGSSRWSSWTTSTSSAAVRRNAPEDVAELQVWRPDRRADLAAQDQPGLYGGRSRLPCSDSRWALQCLCRHRPQDRLSRKCFSCVLLQLPVVPKTWLQGWTSSTLCTQKPQHCFEGTECQLCR